MRKALILLLVVIMVLANVISALGSQDMSELIPTIHLQPPLELQYDAEVEVGLALGKDLQLIEHFNPPFDDDISDESKSLDLEYEKFASSKLEEYSEPPLDSDEWEQKQSNQSQSAPKSVMITISYSGDKNTHGSVPDSESKARPCTFVIASQGSMRKTGYVFAGWKDKNGKIYQPGSQVSYGSSGAGGTTYLTANWVKAGTINVVYNGNGFTGGKVPDSVTITNPGSIKLSGQGTMVRNNHTFGGWEDKNGKFYAAGSTVTWDSGSSGTTTFYARWVANATTYSFTMHHYYDSGYSTRISGAQSAITGHQTVVKNKLQEIFPGLTVSASYNSYRSNADICKNNVTAGNLAATCSHSSNHLTTANLRSKLVSDKGSGTNTVSRYLWSGHFLPGNPASNSSSGNHTVLMLPKAYVDSSGNNLGSSVINTENRFTLIHETSHQLGVPDHYCYGRPANGGKCVNTSCYDCYMNLGSPPVCIMSRRYNIETIATSAMYCNSCKTTISNHLKNHH